MSAEKEHLKSLFVRVQNDLREMEITLDEARKEAWGLSTSPEFDRHLAEVVTSLHGLVVVVMEPDINRLLVRLEAKDDDQ